MATVSPLSVPNNGPGCEASVVKPVSGLWDCGSCVEDFVIVTVRSIFNSGSHRWEAPSGRQGVLPEEGIVLHTGGRHLRQISIFQGPIPGL